PDADRPQLLFAFSDGFDTMSFLDAHRVAQLAEYSTASLYIALVPTTVRRTSFISGHIASHSPPVPPDRKLLEQAATRTGGLVFSSTSGLPDTFQKVLDDFRISYMLRYVPRGVPRSGWHEITV